MLTIHSLRNISIQSHHHSQNIRRTNLTNDLIKFINHTQTSYNQTQLLFLSCTTMLLANSPSKCYHLSNDISISNQNLTNFLKYIWLTIVNQITDFYQLHLLFIFFSKTLHAWYCVVVGAHIAKQLVWYISY